MARGLYRDGGGWVMVAFGANALPIDQALYEEEGHDPPYDTLPTEEEYKASGQTLDLNLETWEDDGASTLLRDAGEKRTNGQT